MKKMLISMLMISMLATSCLKKEEDDDDVVAPVNSISDFYGTWKTDCIDKTTYGRIDTLTVNADGITYTEEIFTETDTCATADAGHADNSSMSGTMSIAGNSASVSGAVNVKIAITSPEVANMNQLLKLAADGSTITFGNPENCTGQECTGSEFPNSISASTDDVFTKQ